MNPTISLLQSRGRKEFQGRTDKYGKANGMRLSASTIQEALAGIAPLDAGGWFSDSALEESELRLARYRQSWNYYYGKHWDVEIEDGERKPVSNFCKKVVDVGVDWLVADGWTVNAEGGAEKLAAKINSIWENNNRRQLTETAGQHGAITGDAFIYVTLITKDDKGEDLPDEKRRIQLSALNPAHCFPFWDPLNPTILKGMLIQFPAVSRTTKDEIVYSLFITDDTWISFENDLKLDEGVNDFGKINVVHIPNLTLADSVFGQSDIHHIMPLNAEYNLVLNSIRRIIKYHAEPTTVIFGARAGDLDKGAKKVWSNLPTDAKVENLVLESDLTATYAYLDRLETLMCDHSSTPKILLDMSKISISNTSGLAMALLFQSIVQKTEKRRVSYRKGFNTINWLILKGLSLLGDTEVTDQHIAQIEKEPQLLYITFTSAIPRDENSLLDIAVKKVALGVWSKAEAARQLSDVKNYRRLALEVAADTRMELALAFEKQKAVNGLRPNPDCAFLGSLPLSQDFSALMGKPTEDKE